MVKVANRLFWRALVPVAAAVLPVVLLLSSLRTLNELGSQRTVYLRSRAAALAGQLESVAPASRDEGALFELLAQDEPALVDLRILDRSASDAAGATLDALWEGRELFRTENASLQGVPVFRTYVPVHTANGLRVARIDLDAGAADFLVVHARHNVIVSTVSGVALVLLSLYAVWASRRAARLEVRQLELEHLAQLGEMSAVLAHEIRNPLGTIKGFAQLLAEQGGGQPAELIEPILSETGRLEKLVRDLLLYGRPPTPVLRRAEWKETRAALEAHVSHLAREAGVEVVLEKAGIAWETDPQLLQQALLNLLRNAVEAAGGREGGRVRVEVSRPASGGVAVAVSDNGPGIPPQSRENLFKPFFTTKANGTGLGLSITRALARSLGGELRIEDGEPTGTVARLVFPDASPREESN